MLNKPALNTVVRISSTSNSYSFKTLLTQQRTWTQEVGVLRRLQHALKHFDHGALCRLIFLWLISQVYKLHCRLESLLTVISVICARVLYETSVLDSLFVTQWNKKNSIFNRHWIYRKAQVIMHLSRTAFHKVSHSPDSTSQDESRFYKGVSLLTAVQLLFLLWPMICCCSRLLSL